MVLRHLRRVRWAVRATLFLGVAASVVANVLHALDNPISQAIAAWPPLALLLTVELISRVPVHRRWLAATRLLATATIAGIAAWVSYWHMAGVAARYGETGASPYLLPLSVDGLIVVASICLVELAGRISSLESQEATAEASSAAAAQPAPGVAMPSRSEAPPEPAIPGLIPTPTIGAVGQRGRAAMDPRARTQIAAALTHGTSETPAFTPAPTRRPATSGRAVPAQRGTATSGRTVPAQRGTVPAQRGTAASRAATSQAGSTARAVTGPGSSTAAGAARRAAKPGTSAKKERRSPAETVALANRIKAERPSLTETEIAAELGISPSRWRTVRREAAAGDHTLAA
ncbi:MAG TPA: DUF2637 domain-containing protein [Actinoplanes sp.]|nr:DUF2637 domain-containing protein [Actinoplanes sp.]